jgi:hypothetical protein
MLHDSEGTGDGEGNSTGASSSLTASTMDIDRTQIVLPQKTEIKQQITKAHITRITCMLAFQFFMWGGYQPMYYIRTRNIFQHT